MKYTTDTDSKLSKRGKCLRSSGVSDKCEIERPRNAI